MIKFRKLRADEIECRISQCFEGNKAMALLYKTARVDRAILDETVGEKWQNEFKVIDGKMYGGIGIYSTELKEWLWRWDCGTESNTEKEKGEASDCFKRAGFKWGIGIELYSSPQIWLNIPTKKRADGKFEPVNKYDKYSILDVGYDENGNINKLIIVNKNNELVYRCMPDTKKTPKKPVKPETKEEIIDSDLDIISGLAGVADTKNLEIYYAKHKDKVKNLEAFITACKNRKEAILNE